MATNRQDSTFPIALENSSLLMENNTTQQSNTENSTNNNNNNNNGAQQRRLMMHQNKDENFHQAFLTTTNFMTSEEQQRHLDQSDSISTVPSNDNVQSRTDALETYLHLVKGYMGAGMSAVMYIYVYMCLYVQYACFFTVKTS